MNALRKYEEKVLQNQALSTAFAASMSLITGVAHGYSVGVAGSSLTPIHKQWPHLPEYMLSLLPSALLLGGAFGASFAGVLLKLLGFKISVLVIFILQIIATVVGIFSPYLELLGATRILFGLSVGFGSAIVSAYVNDVSAPKFKGAISAAYSIFINIGILLGYLAGYVLETVTYSWQILFALALILDAAFAVLFVFMPESPAWRSGRSGHSDETAKDVSHVVLDESESPTSMMKRSLSSDENISAKASNESETEISADKVFNVSKRKMEAHVKGDATAAGKASWRQIFTKENMKWLAIGVVLIAVNQLTGINAVIFYAPTIFAAAGIGGRTGALIAALVVGVINIIGNIVAILLLDRISRKMLVIGGLFIMNIANGCMAIDLWIVPQPYQGYISILLVAVYLLAFQGSIGAAVWVVVGELFVDPVAKQFLPAVLVTVLWVFSLFLGFVFPSMVQFIGIAPSFFIFAVVGFLCQIILTIALPNHLKKPDEKSSPQHVQEDSTSTVEQP